MDWTEDVFYKWFLNIFRVFPVSYLYNYLYAIYKFKCFVTNEKKNCQILFKKSKNKITFT